MSSFTIRLADLADAGDAAALVEVLDSYASDPRGGGQPLSADVRSRLAAGLRAHPTSRAWLALEDDTPIGLCVAFVGFSTFQARPLLNVHDLAVVPARRGTGVGRALLTAAQAHARELGCCKLTLEVQDDNTPARHLYDRFGFREVVYGDSGPTRFLAKPIAG